MVSRTLESSFGTRPKRRPTLSGSLVALVRLLLLWQERANERMRLRELDDHMLKDIGISRAVADREADKPFWRC